MLSRPTGVGVYIEGILRALAGLDRENRYLLFSSSLRERFRAEQWPAFADRTCRDLRIPVRVMNWLWNRAEMPAIETIFGERVDLVHSPHALLVPARSARRIVTIHDLFFLSHPHLVDREMSTDYPRLIRDHARRADGIVTSSEYSRAEIVERLQVDPRKIRVIPPGAPRDPVTAPAQDKLRDAILFVGRIEHRKNVANLLNAFAGMRDPTARLRLIGPRGAGYSEIRSRCSKLGLDDRVDFVEYLQPEELAGEYSRARCFVLPSFCEGFGLPLLEAMRHRVPIAASDVTSIPEVAGDAASYFDPNDPAAIADALDRLWSDEELRQQLVEAGQRRLQRFSWEAAARKMLDFYTQVAQE